MADAPAGPGARALDALRHAVGGLPGGEVRSNQERMCEAVADAFAGHRHLFVQAGTGTGKSLAYLVPAVEAGERVVVVTATKGLQEQLYRKDLPFLADALDRPFTFALLKGRSNYLCRAQLAALDADRTGTLEGIRADDDQLDDIIDWAERTPTGDRADLDHAVRDDLWDRLSLDARECPGRTRCEFGDSCFAETARARARSSDVIVVNAALYAQHLASGGVVLPPHSYVIIDEAHTLEDVCSDAFTVTIGPARLARLDSRVRTLFERDLPVSHPARRLGEWASRLEVLLAGVPADERLDLDDCGLRAPLDALDLLLAELASSLAGITTAVEDGAQRRARAVRLLDASRAELTSLLAATPQTHAIWVDGRGARSVCAAATDVGPTLATTLFSRRTAVLTSATLALAGDFDRMAWRLGLRPDSPSGPVGGRTQDDASNDFPASTAAPAVAAEAGPQDRSDSGPDASDGQEEIPPVDPHAFAAVDVGSPFDYRRQAILYCAAHLPDPRSDVFEAAMLEEAVALVRAAGGRTLGLCTSLRAAAALRDRLREELDGVRVLSPDEIPRARLMEEFAADETSCLVGSLGLWQGLDVPGPAVSLVIIDKIPFARPDGPVALARRERAVAEGRDPFQTIDLPRAAMLLAQGAGRLVRSAEDRGVVAVLDRRLVSAGYGRLLVGSLPPMYRMTAPDRVHAALRRLTGTGG